MLHGIEVDFIVPDKYLTLGAGTNSNFSAPMFDQDYVIDYSYSKVPYEYRSYSGQEFPEYKIANEVVLISRHSFNWSGLVSGEKDIFDDFFKSFNNSFQPFTLRIWTTGETFDDYYMILEPDKLTVTKDKYDLWSITFTCIKLESL